MTAPTAQAENPLIRLARTHAMHQRPGEAEAAYRDALKSAPDIPEALHFVGMCAFARGELAHARRDLEHASRVEPGQHEVWTDLGVVYLAQQRGEDALGALDRALGLEPMHFAARLHRGAALELLHRPDEAAAQYLGAVSAAQHKGEWRDDATTPPALQPAVKHAIAFVKVHRKRASLELLRPLRDQYGAASLERVVRGLDMYLGLQETIYPDKRQFCKFLYVPGLRTTPWYEESLFPWHADLERHTNTIREELRGVLDRPSGVVPFLGTNDNKLLKEQKWLEGTRGHAEWNSFFFHRHGKVFDENARRCPRTTAILDALPLVHIRDHAPEVLFSILTPGSHILPHHGVTNTRLVTHLPLIIPGDCAIRVGGVEHAWQAGRCVTFDDTFEHEAWNRSDKVRAVMILDAWHPDLGEAEREAIALLVGSISDFNRTAGVEAPPQD
ncbi:MAG: aspartyl/asparaginyl beta-hydroxylase domain-containing protein [Rhodanobacteraceae bacterium]